MAVQTDRTVDVAARELRRRILDGVYAVGTRLPAERRLSETLGISRLTLRAAVARLQAEGLVQPRQGSGVTVLEYRDTAGVELLPHLLQHGEVGLLGSFLALRRAIAAEAVATACVRATDAQLDALEEDARFLAEADTAALVAGNLAFSRKVVELADNLPMRLLFNTVTRVYAERPDIADAMLADPDAVRASFTVIVALLRNRDAEAARHTVRTVLEALDARTTGAIQLQDR